MFSHIDPNAYDQQLFDKQQSMTSLFEQFNGPEFELFTSEPLNYRQRAEFRVWHQDDDLYYIMFNSETKQKFRVDNFPVASVLINSAMKALIDNIQNKPVLRQRLFQVDFLSSLSGELLISLLYHKQLDDEWQVQAEELKLKLSTIAPVDIIGRARKQKVILQRLHYRKADRG